MEENINKHQCFSCCLKHLASALVIAGEIKTGYDTMAYHLYLLGNLAEAQEQTAVISPAIAGRIRNIRLEIFGDGGRAELTPMAIQNIITIAENLHNIIEENQSIPALPRSKNCGCRKKQ